MAALLVAFIYDIMQYLLQRVHGGALPASPAMGTFAERQQISSNAKPAIARAAAAMIEPGQVVFIDGGTTAVQLARALPKDLRCTVVTHSPSVAVELVEHAAVEVILIGVKRAISAMAQRTVVLASPEKLATAAPYQIVPIQRIGAIIAHSDTPEALLAPYRALGIAVSPGAV
jgi:DeoR/GlpR family transcriptional regulator of sugar metabolism